MASPDRADPAPGSDEALEAKFADFASRATWRVLARNQARAMLDALQEAEACQQLSPSQLTEAQLIRRAIGRAVDAAGYRPGWRRPVTQVSDWMSGSGIETAWSELHHAGERMLMIQTPQQVKARLPDIDAAVASNVPAGDARLKQAQTRLTALLTSSLNDVDAAREEIRGYLHTADETGDAAHSSVRSFRNLLLAVGSLLAVALAAVSVLHAFDPVFLDLTGPVKHGPDAVEAWEAVVAGSLGGLVGAVWAVSRLGGFSGPYRLPVYLALLRIPVGGATGLLAVVVIQSGLIDALKPQSGLTLLAYAIVFGYAPDVLLRFLDQKAAKVLGQAQSKDDPPQVAAQAAS